MIVFCWSILITLCCVHVLSESPVGSPGQLVTVVAVYRHGDRTPVNPYPNDPYKNVSYWPVDFGQLTNLGKQQHYALGRWFRDRYKTFLPVAYDEKDINVRSTDVDRTLMSAYSNLAGLYEPEGKQIWNPSIAWQPIPVHTKPELEDSMLAMKKRCDKLTLMQNELMKTEKFATINRKNHDLYAYLTRSTGRLVNNIQTLEYLYNDLFIERLNNLTLPAWTMNVFPDKMQELAALSFAVSCYTPQMARLKTGPFFNELLNNLYNMSATAGPHSGKRKLWMYSAHDTTIANILNTLRIFEYHSPPYASTVLFEVYYKNDAHFVNIFYKNSSTPQPMTLAQCPFDCPLEEFARILAPIRIDDARWTAECAITIFNLMPFSTLQDVVIISCAVVFLLMIVTIIAGILCTRPKNVQRNYLRLPDNDDHA